MRRKIISAMVLAGIISGCGGSGGGDDGGSWARLTEENAVIAASSLETLEQPVAMSNFIITALHQLGAEDGQVSGTCNYVYDSEDGHYVAKLKDHVLTVDFSGCAVSGLEVITGVAKAEFSALRKSGQYLEFAGELEADKLLYDHYGEQYTVSYQAHINQKIESAHKVSFHMTLAGDEAIRTNGVPFYFHHSEVIKVLDYNQGAFISTAKADISHPATFKGELALRTPAPLTGKINGYPTEGRYEVRGAGNDVASVTPGSTNYWAKINVSIGRGQDNVEVAWSDMMSGAIVAFPSRRGTNIGDFNFLLVEHKRWYFPEQSPLTPKSSEHPLRPVQSLLVVPAPQPEDLVNTELYNDYEAKYLSDEMYTVTADGPWVTVRFLEDLPVDRTFTLLLNDRYDLHYAEFQFDTKETFEIQVTADQVIKNNNLFTLGAVKVTDEKQPYSITWTQTAGDKDITVNQINSTQATVDPDEMTPGQVYSFNAEIIDPFGRESEANVALVVEDPVKGSSYLSIETDSLYAAAPSLSKFYVVNSIGSISDTDIDIANDHRESSNNAFSLQASGMSGGYADSSQGDTVHLYTDDGHYWASNCYQPTMQAEVLENEWIDEGTDSEGRPLGYQKRALDFTITCDGGTLKGKLRNNSLID